MSIKKQMSVKAQLKSMEQVIAIIAVRLDELSNSFCYEAMKTDALVKLLVEKGVFTEEEHENKISETMKAALEKAASKIESEDNTNEAEKSE